jgi:eukaryotic-like serine/threonine-protein kinase
VNEKLSAAEETIFTAALRCVTREERAAYLEQACAEDPALRQRMENLVRAYDQAGDFLEESPVQTEEFVRKDLRPMDFPAETPGLRIGRYKLLQKIGEGGCGVVYMAEQEEPVRRRVALKIIKLGMDTKNVIARFEAERQALALMDHPNIAKVLDAGATETGRPYFVMELVRGTKMTEYCDQQAMATRERLNLFILVCHAIQHAHQKGIIHRDIKPSNVLVTVNDDVPVPKVIDFGIAKATQQRLTDKTLFTAFEQFIGTPAYMSPEQAVMTSLDIDTRSDIYSLGVLLYELLTGITPFDTKSLMQSGLDEIRRTIREVEPQKPSTRLSTMFPAELMTVAKRRQAEPGRLSTQIRGDLDWIVMKCLEKDRTRRYDTANALSMDLKRYLNDEPVLARPPSQAYRLGKLLRRHKVVVASAVVSVLVLVVGAITSTTMFVIEQRARRIAVSAEHEAQTQRKSAEEADLRGQKHLYASDMRQAQLFLEKDDLGHALELLNRHLPNAANTNDFRGFEWRYLWSLCQGHPHDFLPQEVGWPWWLEFSPDGRYLAAATDSGTNASVTIFEMATKKLVTILEKDPSAEGDPACALFSSDGKMLVTACHNRVKFFEVPQWTEMPGMTFTNVSGPIAYHGNTLVTLPPSHAFKDKYFKDITVWDITNRVAHTLSQVDGPPILSPDGSRLVTDSPDGLKVWPLSDIRGTPLILEGSRQLLSHVSGFQALFKCVAFSPDGKRIAAGGHRGDIPIMIWDAASGKRIDQNRLIGHQSHVGALAWSPNGRLLASCSSDRTVRIWDTDQLKERMKLLGHLREPWTLAYSPSSDFVVSASLDTHGDRIKIWKLDFAEPPQDPSDEWCPLWLSRDGTRVVIATAARGLAHVNRMTGQVLDAVSAPDEVSPKALSAFSLLSDSETPKWAFAGYTNGLVFAWTPAPSPFPRLRQCHNGAVKVMAATPDGSLLITGGEDNLICWWDLASGRLIRSNTLPGRVTVAALSPDGQTFVTSTEHSDLPTKVGRAITLWWWEPRSGRLLASNNLPELAINLAFSLDSKTLAAQSEDSTHTRCTLLFDVTTKVLRGMINAADRSIVFSPDSTKIATTTHGLQVWNVRDASPIGEEFKGNRQMIMHLTFSTDSRTLVSTCDDGTVRLWNVDTQREVLTFYEKGRVFDYPVFSADGTTLAVGSVTPEGWPVRYWRAPSFPEIEELIRTGRSNH